MFYLQCFCVNFRGEKQAQTTLNCSKELMVPIQGPLGGSKEILDRCNFLRLHKQLHVIFFTLKYQFQNIILMSHQLLIKKMASVYFPHSLPNFGYPLFLGHVLYFGFVFLLMWSLQAFYPCIALPCLSRAF